MGHAETEDWQRELWQYRAGPLPIWAAGAGVGGGGAMGNSQEMLYGRDDA